MRNIKFLSNLKNYRADGAYLAKMSNEVTTKAELLQDLYDKLHFPDYFGFNWDALLDCLSDFHWLKEKNIQIVYEMTPSLDQATLYDYVEILMEAFKRLKKNNEHSLVVIFPKIVELEIKHIVKKLRYNIRKGKSEPGIIIRV